MRVTHKQGLLSQARTSHKQAGQKDNRPLQSLLVSAVALLAFIFAVGTLNLPAQSSSASQQGGCDEWLMPCKDTAVQAPAPAAQDRYSSGQTQTQRTPDNDNRLYVDGAGNQADRQQDSRTGQGRLFPPDPVTDFQRLAKSSTGELLPIFGRDLFQAVPSTFAPGDQIAVTPDYIIGAGDDILLRLWGPETFNSQLTVDRSGSIYIPKVGAIHVAGLRFDELKKQITTELSRTYRNFDISVNLGRLRSIQVYVVGEARRPGAYTVSSLSTVLNALFASGGPNVRGSLRHIQVRRAGQTLPEFDLYDLVLHGDKSQDIQLQSGDTIFIPPVGAQVALGGSVRHPAIYELKHESTLQEILDFAGGFSETGSAAKITLERIGDDHARHALALDTDAAGRQMVLRDGDVLYANHITAGYEQSVTIRGNLANPGRFQWHEGMRLSEIIPDRKSLLTSQYWRERNRLGVPVPLFEPLEPSRKTYGNPQGSDPNGAATQDDRLTNLDDQPRSNGAGYSETNDRPDTAQMGNAGVVPLSDDAYRNGELPGNGSDGANDAERALGQSGVDSSPVTLGQQQQRSDARLSPRNRIKIPAPEIDWSYAAIERLDPDTLKSSIVPFNLGKLVKDHDPSQDLELRPGDIVTILSQDDVLVPQDLQTKYVRLEGEFASAGVYSVGPDETLDQLVERAGGLTAKAYLYGSNFNRESARVFQQQRLDEYIAGLSADMERAAAVRAASSPAGVLDPNALAEQRSLIAQLKQLRATGRVVLAFAPNSTGVGSIPRLPLDNGDVFRVPSRPNTVSVVGAVYGQNVFLYDPDRKLEGYVALAGKPNRIADRKHAFIIRADGSIYSRERAQGILSNNFDSGRINPGDSIVIPEKLVKPTALRQLIDYSQILSSFGLAAAAINVVR